MTIIRLMGALLMVACRSSYDAAISKVEKIKSSKKEKEKEKREAEDELQKSRLQLYVLSTDIVHRVFMGLSARRHLMICGRAYIISKRTRHVSFATCPRSWRLSSTLQSSTLKYYKMSRKTGVKRMVILFEPRTCPDKHSIVIRHHSSLSMYGQARVHSSGLFDRRSPLQLPMTRMKVASPEGRVLFPAANHVQRAGQPLALTPEPLGDVPIAVQRPRVLLQAVRIQRQKATDVSVSLDGRLALSALSQDEAKRTEKTLLS